MVLLQLLCVSYWKYSLNFLLLSRALINPFSIVFRALCQDYNILNSPIPFITQASSLIASLAVCA